MATPLDRPHQYDTTRHASATKPFIDDIVNVAQSAGVHSQSFRLFARKLGRIANRYFNGDDEAEGKAKSSGPSELCIHRGDRR